MCKLCLLGYIIATQWPRLSYVLGCCSNVGTEWLEPLNKNAPLVVFSTSTFVEDIITSPLACLGEHILFFFL